MQFSNVRNRIAGTRVLSRRSLANMHHGDVVGIEPLPIGQAVEQRDGGARGASSVAPILYSSSKAQKVGQVLQRYRAMMARDERPAIELGAAVDERRERRAWIKIAAEAVVVEDRARASRA